MTTSQALNTQYPISNIQYLSVERLIDDLLRFGLDLLKVFRTLEAFGIDFVDVLRAGGAGGKPAVGCHHFETANRRAVAGGVG